MRAIVIASIACSALTSCYMPDQTQFNTFVNQKVTVGMPISTAVATLTVDGFGCSGKSPTDCSRIKQRLLPSSCVEWVRLYAGPNLTTVGKVEVQPIVCAGL